MDRRYVAHGKWGKGDVGEGKRVSLDREGARIDAEMICSDLRKLNYELGVMFPAFTTSQAFIAFGNAWQSVAEQAYLSHHRRLPGSLRKRRMKKKRMTKVMAWFVPYLEGNGAEKGQ